MFSAKDKIKAESLILQHPWISDHDFFDFIGNGGSYFNIENETVIEKSKKLFFCKMELNDGKLFIICRFFGGRCDIKFEVLEYAPQKLILKKMETGEIISYLRFNGAGPMLKEKGIIA